MSTVLAFKSIKRRSPTIENGKVAPPRRVTNLARRSREHLTPAEVERMIAAVGKAGRHGVRDGMLILVAYRRGLRVSELVELRWEQVDLPRHIARQP
jgi:integrase